MAKEEFKTNLGMTSQHVQVH
jgi:hypothetical protein